MRSLTTLLAAATLGFSALAPAHTDEELEKRVSPNGGQLRMTSEYHLELVLVRNSAEAKENPVVVYVTDHADQKIDTKGASGTVTLLGKSGKATVALKPDGENRLRGVGRYASEADIKAVVAVTMAGKKTEQARFTPLAKPAPATAATKPGAAQAPHKH